MTESGSSGAGRAVQSYPLSCIKYFFEISHRGSLGLIVDVREPGEYADGHIPGAISVPRGLIEFRIWPHVGFPNNTDMHKTMTLYCASGARCALAAKSLQDLGFSNVTAADMWIEEWVGAGYPLVKR